MEPIGRLESSLGRAQATVAATLCREKVRATAMLRGKASCSLGSVVFMQNQDGDQNPLSRADSTAQLTRSLFGNLATLRTHH